MHVADPIYGPISIHDRDILQLIDTKAFQRLAYIKQQGHTYFLHENAIHTREEHSIGVYVLVNKVIEHLTEIGDIHLSKYERKLVSTVALLHDVGHGPYSHCFQQISGEDHGEWTIRIIQEDEKIRAILNQTPGLLDDITKALTEDGVFPIIDELLFNSLGMDQLDFWNRDLYYSSLELEGLQIEELIASMRFINGKLVIAEQGIPYIEQLMKMKEGLYNNGFGHPFVVGKDLLLQSIFQKIKEKNLSFHTPELQNFFYKRKKIEDFLPLQDEMIINEIKCFAKSDDIEIAALIYLYFSATKSLSFEKGKEGDYKKENSTAVVITEKKAYSSYVGGIYVYSEGQLDDILEKSNFIQEIVKLPKKEYVYFFN
ncbi:TPA: HD domain-containing protein [Bacillus toyonensis]|uniref:HD domain-containing protein n=1 Tax=Bacillus cereus group TaxID=86661 RepID=UPI00028B6323|nr:HD domain-containing protein [Bacillus toyonensis]AFU13456.1 HD domain protein [Bacillus thuringiensis MC28]MED3540323.1 HD domain-containing protein [Bacillus toyonensis]PGC84742.1 HD domain-containing protein [Bacillus toyonensis]PHC43270.1 HD domain-containing protein [Bacillus toyonensis]PHG66710.1 HD domain-containing protein [Bacillus toyonensis]